MHIKTFIDHANAEWHRKQKSTIQEINDTAKKCLPYHPRVESITRRIMYIMVLLGRKFIHFILCK